MSDNIKVVVKVRPLISREIDEKLPYHWRVDSNTIHQLDSNGRDFAQSFTFDKVYSEKTKTNDVYEDVAKPIVDAAVAGINGTIFAYGQTSSGKTYTMTGTDKSPGIIPLSVLNLFEIIKGIPNRDFLIRVSYIEIYNEMLKDLLDVKKENIKIHENYEGSIKVDATERVSASPEEVLEVMREGEANRQTGTTNMNEQSSRSHTIFQITIESREHVEGAEQSGSVNVSQLNLVDLAGSERAGQTGAKGMRFKEGTHINKSLSVLALVIKQLSEEQKFVNFRDSKLTRLLQNSLGGNAKTSIICAVTPAALEETVSTLQFATRAKCIKNKPSVNAVATEASMIQGLTRRLAALQAELLSKRNLERMLENKKNVEQDLQKKIANLQKLILNGFGQQSAAGGAARRAAPLQRRVTISACHSLAEDEPAPAVPRFCTPSLKYNPMCVPSEFAPMEKTQLSPLAEESPQGDVTPPRDRAVSFKASDSIIEIDSDDDADSTSTCSPYHKCYEASKTPPCILRKNAKLAEKNYNEIMEFTEREKIYQPTVVELIEKLEHNADKMEHLKSEVEILKSANDEKDSQIKKLKFEIIKSEEGAHKTKLELEAQVKEYHTKLTDWEVTYETLEKKSKLREADLLSLLEELKQDKNIDIGKLPQNLTCRESNSHNIIESESSQLQNLVVELQDQIIAKSQTILQLESNVASQQKSIEYLEQCCLEFHSEISSFNKKVTVLETENASLQSSVITLNDTIKNKTEDLKKAHDDISSYNCVINELQNKIYVLNGEITQSKEQHNENITTIDSLVKEKSNLTKIEEHLMEKLSEVERQKDELYELNEQYIVQIRDLKHANEQNILSLEAKEKAYTDVITQLQCTVESLSNKVSESGNDVDEKSKLLSALDKCNEDKQKYEGKIKTVVYKLRGILSILNGEVQDIPELIDDWISMLNTLLFSLNIVEQLATDTVAEKDKLNNNIRTMNDTHDKELTILRNEIINLKTTITKLTKNICELESVIEVKCNECDNLQEHYKRVVESENELKERLKSLHDLDAHKCNEVKKLEEELNDKCSKINILHQKYNQLTCVKEEFVKLISQKLLDFKNKYSSNERILICHDMHGDNFDHILVAFDGLTNCITNYMDQKTILDKELELCREELKTQQCKINELSIKVSSSEHEKYNLKIELEKYNMSNENLNEDLVKSDIILRKMQDELKENANEIKCMEEKAFRWKNEFENLNIRMKDEMEYLQLENEKLKSHILELQNETRSQINALSKEVNETDLKKILENMCINKNPVETMSPPSLLTICCNTIVEAIDPKNDCYSVSTRKSDTDLQKICPKCDQLMLELEIAQQENSTHLTIIEELEKTNKHLLHEQQKVRQELRLLLEPAEELQKKIESHKTNLSILTATTYAENKSLKLQLKGLQHHNSRLHTVCTRDLPEFSAQLNKLMSILKGNTTAISRIQNNNLKRYSLPDNMYDNINNESSLDGDLLMLDTNVTLTTFGNNTLVGDQSCSDLTQNILENDVAELYHDADLSERNYINSNFNVLDSESPNMLQRIEIFKDENAKLKQLVDKLSKSANHVDSTRSPTLLDSNEEVLCSKCKIASGILKSIENEELSLCQLKTEKETIERKYNDLLLEKQSLDILESKITKLQLNYNTQVEEYNKLNELLNIRNEEIKSLQTENESLSEKIMENISEIDDMNKIHNQIKTDNLHLTEKIHQSEARLAVEINRLTSQNHELAEEILKLKSMPRNEDNSITSHYGTSHSVQYYSSPHSKLGRSFSDSESSSRYNKICTLQNELHASREDCKVLSEDVATIKQHLDCSNMSVDLDESIGDAKVLGKKCIASDGQDTKCTKSTIEEESSLDVYAVDKVDCYNYYLTITGIEKENLPSDYKILDVMKMFYNNLVAKHGNEVENLVNKIKDFEEARINMLSQIDKMTLEYTSISKTMQEKKKDLNRVSKLINELKHNLTEINKQNSNCDNGGDYKKNASLLKDKILNTLDYEFGISSSKLFNVIISKYDEDLKNFETQCTSLQSQKDILTASLETANRSLDEMKKVLVDREKEYNLLKAQQAKMHEINSAITLDILKKEQDLNSIIRASSNKLVELHITTSINDVIQSESASQNLNTLLSCLINQQEINVKNQTQYENEISLKAKQHDISLVEKSQELDALKSEIETLKQLNNKVTVELTAKNDRLKQLETMYNDLNISHNMKTQENIKNLNIIDKLTKDSADAQTISFNTIRHLKEDNERLLSLNDMILKEKEAYELDLQKAGETITQNNEEMCKMTSDILVLRESVKEATGMIESLKLQVHNVTLENAELKQQFDNTNSECSRLKINIKTYESTAEILNRMIMRLQKGKEEDGKLISEKQTKIEELSRSYSELQKECQDLRDSVASSQEELSKLKTTNILLEKRVSEMCEVGSARDSLETRRRRSVDCRRLADLDEHGNVEALFGARQKHDELFADGDGDSSGRSTPFGPHRGRDSLLSKTDQSEREEECPRPSSVLSARRRRQSEHDLHRGVATHAHDKSIVDLTHSRDTSANKSSSNSEVNQLREQVASLKQELEELEQRYKEVDEECEICAQYLKEREQCCIALCKDKTLLEAQVKELEEKLRSSGSDRSQQTKPPVADASVNTDQDWSNLHAVVVDRMSFDAEVDKNKKLRRTVDELRAKNHDLKTALNRMQHTLDRHADKEHKELEKTKEELSTAREEVRSLELKYKQLNVEYESCSQHLRQCEDRCRRLAARDSTEKKVRDHDESVDRGAALRHKRRTIHDRNRRAGDDLLSSQEEQNETTDESQQEIQRLKTIIEKLNNQKVVMEQQLKATPMYVSTGSAVVQNQQITDVMKENQKLKMKNQKLAVLCKKLSKRSNEAEQENRPPDAARNT